MVLIILSVVLPHAMTWAAEIGVDRLAPVAWSDFEPKVNRLRQVGAWDADLILAGLMALRSRGVRLNRVCLMRDLTPEDLEALAEAVGFATNGYALYRAAIKYWGSWPMALSVIGLDIEEFEPAPWTTSRITELIRSMHATKINLRPQYVMTDPRRLVAAFLMRDDPDRMATGEAFYRAALRHFGSWNAALAAARVPPKLIRDRHSLRRPEILRGIAALYAAGVPLNSGAIQNDYSRYTAGILTKTLGRTVSGGALYARAKLKFGTWDTALHAAGIDPALVRKRRFSEGKCERRLLRRVAHPDETSLN